MKSSNIIKYVILIMLVVSIIYMLHISNIIKYNQECLTNNVDNKIGCCISIPKNASKSILNILDLGRNRNIDSMESTERYIIYENHQRLSVLNKEYNLNNLFTFAFCRNPYDRIMSWYEYHKNMSPYNKYTFREWILNKCPHHWIKQNKTNWKLINESPLLQYNFIKDGKIDFIGRLEFFERDMKILILKLNELCEKNNISHRFKFENIKNNTSQNQVKDYKKIYSNEMKHIVYNLFKKDFEYFGYDSELHE